MHNFRFIKFGGAAGSRSSHTSLALDEMSISTQSEISSAWLFGSCNETFSTVASSTKSQAEHVAIVEASLAQFCNNVRVPP